MSSWTTGNGTDVLGSGVLQGNLNLVGGVAYTSGTGSNVSLTDVLYGKVAGTIGNIDGQTRLFFQRGIEANYLLASGHGILAATLGPGKSVVGSADGAIISNGVTKAPVMAGGGNFANVSSGGSGSTGGNTTAAINTGTSSTTSSNTTTSNTTAANAGGNGGGNGNGGGQGADGGGQPDVILLPVQANKPNENGLAIPRLETPAAEVPEPSSIALLLLGMMGAGAITRRRSR
jgi:hypothetical protein